MKHNLKKFLAVALTGILSVGVLPNISVQEVSAEAVQNAVTMIPGTEDLRKEGTWDPSYLSVSGFAATPEYKVGDRSAYASADNEKYATVKNAEEFLAALYAARTDKIEVIEVTEDIDLGWMALSTTAREIEGVAAYEKSLESAHCSYTNPDLIQSGISEVQIANTKGLTIFSKNGSALKHAEFKIQATSSDIVIRNLRFEGMWEWDDIRAGYTTKEPGGHKRNGWTNIKINGAHGVWIDHCSFGIAFDGNIDISGTVAGDGNKGVSITWCTFGEESFEPGSMVYNSIEYLESIYQENLDNESDRGFRIYAILRDNGFTKEECMVYGAFHSKCHLTGDGDGDYKMNPFNQYTLAFNQYYNMEQRVPMVRQGSVHLYNCVVNDMSRYDIIKKLSEVKNEAGVTVYDQLRAAGVHIWVMTRCIDARNGASIAADTCVYYGVDQPLIGSEKHLDGGNLQGTHDFGYNHSLIVNSSVTRFDRDVNKMVTYDGSSWDTWDKKDAKQGDNQFTTGHTWSDRRTINNWTWKELTPSTASDKAEYDKYINQKFDTLPYSYKTISLEEMKKTVDPNQESVLNKYGGAGILDMTSAEWAMTDYNADFVVKTMQPNMDEVTGITLVEEDTTLLMVEKLQLHAVIAPVTAADKSVVWSSSDEDIATVGKGGLVTPLKPGKVTITATASDTSLSAVCEITVCEQPTDLIITGLPDEIYVGDIYPLSADIEPAGVPTEYITWESGSKNTADVSQVNGKWIVTANAEGYTTIKANTGLSGISPRIKELSRAVGLSVVECPVTTTGVELDVTSAALTIGEGELTPITLQASVLPANATNPDVYWTSSNDKVATVENGVVTPIATGTAVITVTTVNGGKTAEFVITIQEKSEEPNPKPPVSGDAVIYGDVDGNEKIETKDAVAILKYLSNKTANPLSGDALKAANVDGNFEADGTTPKIETKDAVWILKYCADKKNVVFPVLKKE